MKLIEGYVVLKHQIYILPIVVVIFIVIIGFVVKWAVIVVIVVIIAANILSFVMNGIMFAINVKRKMLADRRGKKIDETISGIKNVKFNAWEKIILKIIGDYRQEEKTKMIQMWFSKGISESCGLGVPIIASIFTIWMYNAMYDNLSLAETFSLITMINLIGSPVRIILFSVMMYTMAGVAEKRVSVIVEIKEREAQMDDEDLQLGEIKIEDGEFCWDDPECIKIFEGKDRKMENITSVLKDINIHFAPKTFSGIIGKVGSGKSSLLLASIGEMIKKRGRTRSNGKIAFIPQEAFLLNDTLKNNILFGNPYDKEKYKKIINICQLIHDLEQLPAGDQTEIGEKGINLSGGQKQRISIARAVYSDCDIYVIDDSLSALDAYVGKTIMDKVFKKHLRNKTRIMVTHHIHLLKELDQIILIAEGKVAASGKLSKVEKTKEYKEFANTAKDQEEQENKEKVDESHFIEEVIRKQSINSLNREELINIHQNEQIAMIAQSQLSEQDLISIQEKEDKTVEGKINVDESRNEGQVGFSAYKFYFQGAGYCFSIFTLLSFISATAIRVVSDWWAGRWASESFDLSENAYPLIYLGIGAAFIAAVIFRSIIGGYFSARAGISCFSKVMSNILKRPIEFFDTTPSGVIMNRCTMDVEAIDFLLPNFMTSWLDSFFMICFTLILVILVSPPMIIIVVIACIYIYMAFVKSISCTTEIRRLTQLATSTSLSRISEMINGFVTLSNYRKSDWMLERASMSLNQLSCSEIHEKLLSVWLNIRFEVANAIMILASCILMAVNKEIQISFSQDPSDAGLAISYMFVTGSLITWFLMTSLEISKSMSSVERLQEYSEYKIHERDYENPPKPENWPSEGKIEFKDVNIRYRKGLPLVIKDLSFEVHAHEKVGVLGRTGSGKSTLILSLMRIIEMAEDDENIPQGKILIDGIDIASLGLNHVRRAVSIIPQDPFLLEGSLKFNVDPESLFTDKQIIEILKTTNLWDTIRMEDVINQKKKELENNQKKKKNVSDKEQKEDVVVASINIENEMKNLGLTEESKLDFKIASKGSNLSIGQRQLVCIARAIIKKPKILLMDEATANIDQKTDSIIQRVIKNCMGDCTVLTIAHRLITIIQYDKLVVLNKGEVEQVGPPSDLLKKEGLFKSLIEEGGADFARKMVYLASNRDADPTLEIPEEERKEERGIEEKLEEL